MIQLIDSLNHITTKNFIDDKNMQRNQDHTASTYNDLID
jgi:hypothetical protein